MTLMATASPPAPADEATVPVEVSGTDVWRPVQYLGSKLRALDTIAATASELATGGVVWDAFTGSSVVAQAATRAGFDVWATDTQRSSVAFARALLGVGATQERIAGLPELVDDLLREPHPEEAVWAELREREQAALEAGDYEELIELHGQVPQRWRTEGDWHAFTPLTSTFAGTYLSLAQAMTLDAARLRLRRLSEDGALDSWSVEAALTALCHAASEAVHSAGKHFAQPMQPSHADAANYRFVRSRALKDRAVSVPEKARDGARQIAVLAPPDGANEADRADVLAVSASDLRSRQVSTVYADPPYTAQQYSRFYHVLETLTDGILAPIQSVRGKAPKGLYPAERYLSPFCSRRQAPEAFGRFISSCRDAEAHLMLSYSTTGSDSGNARTVNESELLAMVRRIYGAQRVSVVDLEYGYRQFNHDSRRTETSGTGEILIVGEA